MAIRKRAGRKSPWQVYWNNPFTGKREAANFADEQEAKKYDSLIRHRLKFERESFRNNNDREKEEITLEMAFILFLKEKQFSRKYMAFHLDAMRPVLKMHGQKAIGKIDKTVFNECLAYFQSQYVCATTVRHRAATLRRILAWCVEKEMCAPITFPRLPSASYKKFIPPTPEELATMLHAAPHHIQRVIILGSQCGVRVGPCELFQLTWQDVDFSRAALIVHGSRKNKNAPWREIPLRQGLLSVLHEWRELDQANGIAHIINYDGKPVTSIKRAWTTMLKNAGITRRIRPYDLRHAFATELIAAGVDIGTVAKLMGHSSPTMILNHYQYVMDRQKREAVENLPEIEYVPKPCAQKEKGPRLLP